MLGMFFAYLFGVASGILVVLAANMLLGNKLDTDHDDGINSTLSNSTSIGPYLGGYQPRPMKGSSNPPNQGTGGKK